MEITIRTRRTNGRTDRRTNGGTEGRTDERTEGRIIVKNSFLRKTENDKFIENKTKIMKSDIKLINVEDHFFSLDDVRKTENDKAIVFKTEIMK